MKKINRDFFNEVVVQSKKMSEEPVTNYSDGDIVWVKLGARWWPGEVKEKNNLPPEVLDFKKEPLVIVKFFEEDSYEYVRSWSNIYPYNCDKKVDFIKRGMAGFRSKAPHMEKFPKDVSQAEIMIGGNPNILSEPEFLPERRINYAAEIFGTPSPRARTSKDKKSKNKKSKFLIPNITHRRFLGNDDYKAIICIQYPGKDNIHDETEVEEIIRLNKESEQEFNCQSCSFSTRRIEVMILHTKSHIQGVYISTSKKSRPDLNRSKKVKKSRKRSSHVRSESGSTDEGILSEAPKEKKRKVKQPSPTRKPSPEPIPTETPEKSTDIRSHLLAEWEESDEDLDDTINTNQSSVLTESFASTFDDGSEKTLSESQSLLACLDTSNTDVIEKASESQVEIVPENKDEEEKKNETEPPPKDEEAQKVKNVYTETQQAIKSCFDFDEEEEEEHTIIAAAVTGRKIPRVIPITERRKTDDLVAILTAQDDPIDDEEVSKINEKSNDNNEGEMDNAFKELMELTAVPELPELQNTLKCEQNFHCTKTIKFPDKQDSAQGSASPKSNKTEKSESSEIATKLTNPKKRFVKSFEDFELMQNEIKRKEELEDQMTIEDEPDKTSPVEDKCGPDFLKLKSKIMSKIIEEANINEESKIKIMSKITGSHKTPAKRRERTGHHSSKALEAVDKNVDSFVTEPTVKADSFITEPTVKTDSFIVEPTVKLDSFVTEPSVKADSFIMEPIVKADSFLTEPTEKDKTVHKTPRSKILECYLNEKNKFEAATKPLSVEVGKKVELPQTETTSRSRLDDGSDLQPRTSAETGIKIVPPKKNKWSRRVSHPKKDRKIFEIDDVYDNATLKDSENEAALVPSTIPKIDVVSHAEKYSELEVDKIVPDVQNDQTTADLDTAVPLKEQEVIIDAANEINTNVPAQTDTVVKEHSNEDILEETLCPQSDAHPTGSRTPVLDMLVPDLKASASDNCIEDSSRLACPLTEDTNSGLERKETIMDSSFYRTDGKVDRTIHLLDCESYEVQMTEESCSNTFSLSNKDEFSPVEKASVFLPEDAICSPPRKNKKRKKSKSFTIDEEEISLESESKRYKETDLYLLGKRRKEHPDDWRKDEGLQSNHLESDNSRALQIETSLNELALDKESEGPPALAIKIPGADEELLSSNHSQNFDQTGNSVIEEVATEELSPKQGELTEEVATEVGAEEEKPIQELPGAAEQIHSADDLTDIDQSKDVEDVAVGESKLEVVTEEVVSFAEDELSDKTGKVMVPSCAERRHSEHAEQVKQSEEMIYQAGSDKVSEEIVPYLEEKRPEEVAEESKGHEHLVDNFEAEKIEDVTLEQREIKGESADDPKMVNDAEQEHVTEEMVHQADEHIKPQTAEEIVQDVDQKLVDSFEEQIVTEEIVQHIDQKLDDNFEEQIVTEEVVQHIDEHQTATEGIMQRVDEQETVTEEIGQNVDEQQTVTEEIMQHIDEQQIVTEEVIQHVDEQQIVTEEVMQHIDEQQIVTEEVMQPIDEQQIVTEEIMQHIDEHQIVTEDMPLHVDEHQIVTVEMTQKIEQKPVDSIEHQPTNEERVQHADELKLIDSFEEQKPVDVFEHQTVTEDILTEHVDKQKPINDFKEQDVAEEIVTFDDQKAEEVLNVEQKPVVDSELETVTEEVIQHIDTFEHKGVTEEVVEIESVTEMINTVEEKPGDEKITPIKIADDEVTDNDTNMHCSEEPNKSADHHNEVEIECLDNSSSDAFKFSIQTNLSNFSSREEISAIALATLAEIKSDLENSDSNVSEDSASAMVPPKTELSRGKIPPFSEPELVPIEGNLTVVSEKDLADGQVEITTEQVINTKKPAILSNFSMDLSDSTNDSTSTNDTLIEAPKYFDPRGTEFTSRAMMKEIRTSVGNKKENTYERFELLDILEGNSDSEKKIREYKVPKRDIVDDFCDFEDHIPSQIVCAKKLKQDKEEALREEFKFNKEKSHKSSIMSTTSKLLERLTEKDKSGNASKTDRFWKDSKHSKELNTSSTKAVKGGKSKSGVILSSTTPLILPEPNEPAKSTQLFDDIEDMKTFVIHKDLGKHIMEDAEDLSDAKSAAESKTAKSSGKAKILQQTIITPTGEIIQPAAAAAAVAATTAQTDDNIFDINSMPIVLSDEILTPESIENMPIVISSDATMTSTLPQEKIVVTPAGKKTNRSKIVAKLSTTAPPTLVSPTSTSKPTSVTPKQPKVTPRILQSVSNRVLKSSPLLPGTSKPGKYIIVPQSAAGLSAVKNVPKKSPVAKKSPTLPGLVTKVPNIVPEISGNKIMILTNGQGHQQRLLLTPAQQKMLGYQNPGVKMTKTIVNRNIVQKTMLAAKSIPITLTTGASTSTVPSKPPSLVGQKLLVSNSSAVASTSQILGSGAPPNRVIKATNKRLHSINQKVLPSTNKNHKTILIKNQHGHTVKKMQGTDEELEKQVAEQLEAIKASSGVKFGSQPIISETSGYKPVTKTPMKRSYSKKSDSKSKPMLLADTQSTTSSVIPFTTPKKSESSHHPTETKSVGAPATVEPKIQSDRPLNQLVIQDAVGNQTTITEGQILALPSETVDGQPQSYMLVTLDESGNLTPLNNEALMSLDPNLCLGGDLSNMVLQIEQGSTVPQPLPLAQPAIVKTNKVGEMTSVTDSIQRPSLVSNVPPLRSLGIAPKKIPESVLPLSAPPPVIPSTNGEPGQQLIISGDPIATQKFLESLTEGTTDLANILANADGNSILIQADGQQILINTNSDNQMLLSVNNDNANVNENTEGGGNPIFATQPNKNQDILAAALADTDVFQPDQHAPQSKITSQLSPNNTLYPMNVGNVLETSLTLSSPIMTPLEVPSTNNKKIPDEEADILTHVPKNVDLPITITDPNISQTVANQQVASLIASELHTNLELALPISETTISTVSKDLNSPSYSYSLPTLDDSVDLTQKTFNSSMPLLNEDVEESPELSTKSGIEEEQAEIKDGEIPLSKPEDCLPTGGSFLEEEEGRFTLGGEMCSSLSEPPPEMFDLPDVSQGYVEKNSVPSSLQSTPDPSEHASKDDDTTDLSTLAESSNDGSCEIPVQPPIIAKSQNLDALSSD